MDRHSKTNCVTSQMAHWVLCFVWTIAWVPSALAAKTTIAVISPANTALYIETLTGITDNIDKNTVVEDYYLGNEDNIESIYSQLQNIAYIITIGQSATESAIKSTRKPPASIIGILTPSAAHSQDLSKIPHFISGIIYIDQPNQRKLNVIKKILPQTKRIGILYSQPMAKAAETMSESIKANTLTPVLSQVNNKMTGLMNIIDSVSRKSDVILALPDPDIYNRHTIKRILIKTYINKTPIIGYSRALTHAGALASTHTPPYYIGKEAAEIINLSIARGFRLKRFLKHPKYYAISVNKKIADSMSMRIDDALLSDTIRQD